MRSTYQSYLMYKETSSAASYTKLIDIKSFPDLGGEPEKLDATTLSDPMRVYIEGIQDTNDMTFTANYSLADYKKIKALEGVKYDFAVWMGADSASGNPDGHDGKFSWKGTISAKVDGGNVNEVTGMTITCVPNTIISCDN